MVQVKLCLLLAALCACCGLGSSDPGATEKPIIIPIPIIASSNLENKTAVQEPAPVSPDNTPLLPVNTSTAPTTSSPPTASPTSSSPTNAPPTSSSPTTAPSTSSPTTAPPSTTHPTTTQKPTPIPPPAPTPAPGPLPPPEQGTWPWMENNVTCIVLQFAAQLNITYTKNVNDGTALGYLILNVPANATAVGGTCAATEQIITLSWSPAVVSNYTNTMTFTYNRNDTTKLYSLKSMDLELSPDQFVNATSNSMVVLKHGSAWPTPLSTSYRCMPATRFNLTGDVASGSAAALTFTKLQEEAFRSSNTTVFSAARECGGDVPDAVPIAVGCALGGLVLVVLVAYLVGRRRSNARGYLSM